MNARQRPSLLPGLAPYILLFCATVVAYLPALHGALLWDDDAHVTRPDLRSWAGLRRIWSVPGATQQYYPLLHSAFWLEHRIWGDSVLAYHTLNVALHALAACLVVAIVRRLALSGAWLAGLLFALHPVCVEAVAWISEQKSTLSGVFYFAALLAYLKFDDSRKRSFYATSAAWFAAALLTKTVTAVLPAALLAIVWWRRGRLEWKRDVRPLAPLFVLGACAGLFTAWVELRYIGASGAEFALTPIQRCLLAGRALWFYAGKIVWPADLSFFYPRGRIDAGEWTAYLWVAAAVVVGVVSWGLARRNRGPLATTLIFAGTLFPALGFLNVYPFRYSFVADHFAYLAVPVLLVPVAAVISTQAARWAPRPAPLVVCAIVLGALTWQQAGKYRDDETLYRATLAVNPDAWLAHNNLGNLLLDRGNRPEAWEHLDAARRLAPDAAEVHLSMGNYLVDEPGRLEEAIAEYSIAERQAPESERAHANLGNALLRAGRTQEATAELQQALRIDANNAVAHNDLGNALMQTGHRQEAIAEYRLAIAADADFAEPHNNLARALAQMPGELPAAIAELEAAIRIKPDYWSAHSNLGNALSLMPGRLPDAIAEYRAALRLRPDAAAIHNNLGFALSHSAESLPEAIAEYREAIRLAPDFADAHYNLAMALMQAPNSRPEALAEFEVVRRLKPGVRLPQ